MDLGCTYTQKPFTIFTDVIYFGQTFDKIFPKRDLISRLNSEQILVPVMPKRTIDQFILRLQLICCVRRKTKKFYIELICILDYRNIQEQLHQNFKIQKFKNLDQLVLINCILNRLLNRYMWLHKDSCTCMGFYIHTMKTQNLLKIILIGYKRGNKNTKEDQDSVASKTCKKIPKNY